MVLTAFLVAALLSPQEPLKFELLNKPGRVPYLKFAVEMQVTNMGDKSVRVTRSLPRGSAVGWEFHDDKGQTTYLNKYTAEYASFGEGGLFPLAAGKHVHDVNLWRYEIRDLPQRQRLTFQAFYEPGLSFTPKSGSDIVTGPIPSNKLVLEVGPGYVNVISNDLYKPKPKKH